ncbi:hypothetical protein EWM64_g5326 [Hericium alpestre]|uniref:Uncharacterized protein n=1 Tax=Hericium alpestre TaxID=135208 RepID=A0A4Y9ZV53_9AGAM|nr:hypothetical protein EWM64_g5326 [Hericium alpestre]
MDRPLARSANCSREERRKQRLAENPGLRTLYTTNYKDVVHARRIAQPTIKPTTGGGPSLGLAEDAYRLGFGGKTDGLSEEVRGKVTRKPRRTGDLKREEKEQADAVDLFNDNVQKPDQGDVKPS